jgi:hypothetical protein
VFDPDFVVPVLIFSIPIFAIIGGITAGIVRMTSQQRLLELAQKERIAAIERGIDPAKLPSFPAMAQEMGGIAFSPYQAAKRRAQGLLIGGMVLVFGGVGVLVFLRIMEEDGRAWAVGLIPMFVGVALLLSAFLVWPRNGHSSGASAPPPAV